jgi:hypothetical protein
MITFSAFDKCVDYYGLGSQKQGKKWCEYFSSARPAYEDRFLATFSG